MAGLGLVVLAGLLAVIYGSGGEQFIGQAVPSISESQGKGDFWGAISLALIFVLYTYGGWNDAAFVAAEMRDRKRNIPLALILGTLSITVIYLLVNAAYLAGLGLEGAKSSEAVAADLLRWPMGPIGADVMSFLVIISALGAVSGLIFTGARVFSALGSEHRVFAWLGHWNAKTRSPFGAVVAQGVVSIGLIFLVGSAFGSDLISSGAAAAGLAVPLWSGRGGFEMLLMCTAPIFWLFFLLTGLSLFVLRHKEPNIERPFRVPFYPITPLLFCLTCAYMLYRSVGEGSPKKISSVK